jgi:hypothetical protein
MSPENRLFVASIVVLGLAAATLTDTGRALAQQAGSAAKDVFVTNTPANAVPVAGQVGVNNFPTGFNVNNFPSGFDVNNSPTVKIDGTTNTVQVSNFPSFPSSINVGNFPATVTIDPMHTTTSTTASGLSGKGLVLTRDADAFLPVYQVINGFAAPVLGNSGPFKSDVFTDYLNNTGKLQVYKYISGIIFVPVGTPIARFSVSVEVPGDKLGPTPVATIYPSTVQTISDQQSTTFVFNQSVYMPVPPNDTIEVAVSLPGNSNGYPSQVTFAVSLIGSAVEPNP